MFNFPEMEEKNKDFENGDKLSRDYFRFFCSLGEGAFGKVYKVSPKTNENLYALKVLSKNQLSQLKLMNQLKNEIKILAKCNHPNIIYLYAGFEDEKYIYLVMELANEGNLYKFIKKSKRLS